MALFKVTAALKECMKYDIVCSENQNPVMTRLQNYSYLLNISENASEMCF